MFNNNTQLRIFSSRISPQTDRHIIWADLSESSIGRSLKVWDGGKNMWVRIFGDGTVDWPDITNIPSVIKNITDLGDGTKFLSDDGTYKVIDTATPSLDEVAQVGNITNLTISHADGIANGDSATMGQLNYVESQLGNLIAENTVNIAENTVNIERINTELESLEHFRGYFASNQDILDIPDPRNGNFAYSAESGTKWVYDGSVWINTGIVVPDQLVPKSITLPKMNGVAEVGNENAYASGSHVHPSDTSKADSIAVEMLEDTVGNISNNVEAIETRLGDFVTGATMNGIDVPKVNGILQITASLGEDYMLKYSGNLPALGAIHVYDDLDYWNGVENGVYYCPKGLLPTLPSSMDGIMFVTRRYDASSNINYVALEFNETADENRDITSVRLTRAITSGDDTGWRTYLTTETLVNYEFNSNNTTNLFWIENAGKYNPLSHVSTISSGNGYILIAPISLDETTVAGTTGITGTLKFLNGGSSLTQSIVTETEEIIAIRGSNDIKFHRPYTTFKASSNFITTYGTVLYNANRYIAIRYQNAPSGISVYFSGIASSNCTWTNITANDSGISNWVEFIGVPAVAVTTESGSWNPLINGNPLSNYTATAVDASYTKIGNRVNIRGYIAFTSAQSSSEQVVFTNLPFTAIAGRRQPVYIDAQGLISNGLIKGIGGMIHPGTRNLQLYYNEEVSGLWARPPLNMTRVGAGSSFEFNFDYTTSE